MHQLVAEWRKYLDVELGRLPTTIGRYARVLNDLIAFLDASPKPVTLPLESLGKKHLRQFLRSYAKRSGVTSASSWNLALGALRSFYGFLFEEELLPLNPALRIRRRTVKPGDEPLPLSLDEFLSLSDAMEGAFELYAARNVAIATVFYHCGLRVTELVSLNLDQIDFENGFLLRVRTKGNKRLSVAINDEVKTALRRYLKVRRRFGAPADENALFLSDRGRRMSVRAVQEMVKTYGRRAGIKRPLGCHLLRHSNATVLADLGVPLPAIQEWYDHESISTTRRYVHVRDRVRRRAADRLSQYVARHRERRQKNAA